MALQGPHQGAQKSTKSGVADEETAALKVSVVRWVILSDMWRVLVSKRGCGEKQTGRLSGRGLLDDVGQLDGADLAQVLSALLELLEGLDDRLRHALVGLGRAPEYRELLSRGDPLVTVVVVEAEPEKGIRPASCRNSASIPSICSWKRIAMCDWPANWSSRR